MTIKEIEALAEMTRANIRFYEAEGLLSPARSTNGYRDYSENDLEILKRIKLLRTLHISLEEIKALHTGERELTEVLGQQLVKFEAEKANLEQSQEICKAMRSDGVRYQTLNAQHYLDTIEHTMPVPELAADTVPKVRSPWRRFFARRLDLFIYSSLWMIFLSVVMDVNISRRSLGLNLLAAFVVILLMIFIEPALLSIFGTTVGKWILGLRVEDNNARRLSYSEALSRTGTVSLKGMGLNIPIYNLVRLWKSYSASDEGEALEWECDSTISLRDTKVWRIVVYIGVYAVVFGLLLLTFSMAGMPKHRGEITVAEFCENYNQASRYNGIDTDVQLDEKGKWVDVEDAIHVLNINGINDKPDYIFTEKDGVMTGLSFSKKLDDRNAWPPDYRNVMILSIISFVQAQNGCSPFSKDVKEIVNQIIKYPFETFRYTGHGVSITCDVVYSGYMGSTSLGTLVPEQGAETDYAFRFIMAKE